ncbi:MAG: hydantoinase B/oxoprolinase family protein [Thermodesulfobacteriota bacterium]|nr:hydantoinase B/oxoprolinase family protein [Thermodesulfobacteriota bacterium]
MAEFDMVKYEIFRHRLFNILEEGRIAIKMVSGSPVVVEGGETMCSFYTSDGTPILTAAGILLHCTGARDFILKTIQWYKDSPGINDGDQFFFNDPYIGGQHLADQIIVKPIFFKGKRIAWTGSFMHTAETGGIEPGGMPTSSTEIFHEGIRILGLKIVEGGKFRPDVFNTIVNQVRDPHLIGLDTKAKIAGNNVCAKRFLELASKYGLEFVEKASLKIIDDSEKMARAKLRGLPDGVWKSRLYGDYLNPVKGERGVFKVECTMTKEDDEVIFDYTDSSPQVEGSVNSTLAASWGQLFVTLSSQLFWNVPWNGGMITPVKLIIPEGRVINCRYPAACSNGVITSGMMLSETAHECIAKMFYASGNIEDVNSGWVAISGGAPYFGGVNQYGEPTGGVILDGFGGGIGGTPARDGVDTGGGMMNPTSNISDVEILELNIPLIYLSRKNAADSGGFGKFDGGMSPESVYMVYNTPSFVMGLMGGGSLCPGGYGMFGGYPPALQENRFALNSDAKKWFKDEKSPKSFKEIGTLNGKILDSINPSPVIPVKSYDILISRAGSGGGYGDPIERDPEFVEKDIRLKAISPDTAKKIYGVVINKKTKRVDKEETEKQREKIIKDRMKKAKRLKLKKGFESKDQEIVMRMHEYLEIVKNNNSDRIIRCIKCGYEFCYTKENYKEYALLWEKDLKGINLRYPISGEDPKVRFQEFICPGCGILLEVDLYSAEIDKDSPLIWDIKINL